jgi:hypothetical protein
MPTPTHFWLSFASDARFLGACIVPGATFKAAFEEACRRGLNPGGECVGAFIDAEGVALIPDPDQWIGRLLTQDECLAFDRMMGEHGGPVSPEEIEQGLGAGFLEKVEEA